MTRNWWVQLSWRDAGESARALSYLLLCARLGYRLPGKKTMPLMLFVLGAKAEELGPWVQGFAVSLGLGPSVIGPIESPTRRLLGWISGQ